MNIKTLYVAVGQEPFVKEFTDIDEMVDHFGGEYITTFQSGIVNIGIVAGDQDNENASENALGIKGDWLMVGMENPGDPSMAIISSLQDHEIVGLRIGLKRSIEKGVTI